MADVPVHRSGDVVYSKLSAQGGGRGCLMGVIKTAIDWLRVLFVSHEFVTYEQISLTQHAEVSFREIWNLKRGGLELGSV